MVGGEEEQQQPDDIEDDENTLFVFWGITFRKSHESSVAALQSNTTTRAEFVDCHWRVRTTYFVIVVMDGWMDGWLKGSNIVSLPTQYLTYTVSSSSSSSSQDSTGFATILLAHSQAVSLPHQVPDVGFPFDSIRFDSEDADESTTGDTHIFSRNHHRGMMSDDHRDNSTNYNEYIAMSQN
jgi:hypothetical protein